MVAGGSCANRAALPQTLPDTRAVAVRNGVQVPDTATGRPGPVVVQRDRWLGEPLVRSAAAGGMQPAPMGTTKPGGQAAPELAADIGHGWPGERAGLLEAEVVDLEPGHLAGLPAADHRPGDLVGGDADLGPGVLGPGAQLAGEVDQKDQLTGLSFGVPGEELVDHAAGRLGY